jgi:hypothetical protein
LLPRDAQIHSSLAGAILQRSFPVLRYRRLDCTFGMHWPVSGRCWREAAAPFQRGTTASIGKWQTDATANSLAGLINPRRDVQGK